MEYILPRKRKQMKYIITGIRAVWADEFPAEEEVLEIAPNKKEAIRLVEEYRIAFKGEWIIKYERK